MNSFILRWIVTALATATAVWLVPGLSIVGEHPVISILLVSVLFGVVNAILKPVAMFFSACLLVLTFGLFILVINGGMLMVASALASSTGYGLHVADFGSGVLGALIISVVSALLGGGLGTKRRA